MCFTDGDGMANSVDTVPNQTVQKQSGFTQPRILIKDHYWAQEILGSAVAQW